MAVSDGLNGQDGLSAGEGASGLLDLSAELLQRCGSFFEPVVLAQLDAALAHELAHQAQQQSVRATEEVDRAIREGRPSEALAHLVHRSATATSVAAKSASQAALASTVVESLGGCVVGRCTESAESAVGAAVMGAGFDPNVVDRVCGADLIDLIAGLEEAKNGIAAVQAQAQTLFVAQQRLDQARAGVPKEKIGKGIAQQVGLARHESPYRGRQLCQMSEVLVREMPYSMNSFSLGQISEYRVGQVVAETAFLSLEDRAKVDLKICGDPAAVALLGTRELCAETRKAAYALDPEAFVKRRKKALGDRYVSLRPAADGMTFLTALIPLKQGVRILATLTRVADHAKATGDERGKGQIMADALMHRLVRHTPCDEGAGDVGDHRGTQAGRGGDVGRTNLGPQLCTAVDQPDITLELIMTDRSLFGGANDPAILVGHEPIPAPAARAIILGDDNAGGFSAQVWLKRLFTHPESRALLAMDSRARLFPEGIKEFLRLQDQRCQTPYCDAPIREYDHVKAYAAGGATSVENGQGLCSACNQEKEAEGWMSEPAEAPGAGPPGVILSTPTGHRYVSTAPALPG
ncbi:HNH endonuclease [Arthrobacter sp. TWP1-1]|uniref:HNH endonuclease n=1 Tax=Arthrobacter sp. TWP1-1 TaxID=2804568 RepID=UPI003CF4092A